MCLDVECIFFKKRKILCCTFLLKLFKCVPLGVGGGCRIEVYSVQKLVRYFIAVFGDSIKLRNPDEYYKVLGKKGKGRNCLCLLIFFLLCSSVILALNGFWRINSSV